MSLLYCHYHFVLSAKRGFFYRNFQLGPRKSVRCKEVSAKNCPLHRGFFIRILYETNPFLKKCPLEGGVRYREVSLYFRSWLHDTTLFNEHLHFYVDVSKDINMKISELIFPEFHFETEAKVDFPSACIWLFSILNRASSWAITGFGNQFCLKKRSRLMKALDNSFTSNLWDSR